MRNVGLVFFGLFMGFPAFAVDTASTVRVKRPQPTLPRPIRPVGQSSPSMAPRPATAPRPSAVRPAPVREQAVDLDSLSAEPAPTGSSSMSTGGMSPHKSSGILPNFKFYFDFLLKSWKGVATGTVDRSDFTFDSYHQRVLVEFTPNPDLMFQADISSWAGQSPKYFEVDYMLSKSIQLRWGRIWIPFDDMAPHSIFGGRINTSKFFQGDETAFLPDIWADMGIGMKFILSDSGTFSSDLNLYVVNGFQDGTSSPVSGEGTNVTYPNFSGTSGASTDNNNAKGMGARWHSLTGRRFGLGASVYRDTYTGSSVTDAKGLLMLGLDVQFRPTSTTELRAGYTKMKVDIGANPNGGTPTPPAKDSFLRTAAYAEIGQKFGSEDRWKFLLRGGFSQNDNRVIDVSDKTIVGATLLRNFGAVEAQLTYARDLHQVATKFAYNYGAFRLVTAF